METVKDLNLKPNFVFPAVSVEAFIARQNAIEEFVSKCLTEGIENDFGVIPGTKKKILLLPGAEKFERFFGLRTEPKLVESTVDPFGAVLGTAVPFYYYRFETPVFNEHGVLIHIGHGTANSQESKWGFKWVDAEVFNGDIPKGLASRSSVKRAFAFAVKEAKTEGQYSKPQEYWDEFNRAIENGTAKEIDMEASTGRVMKGWQIGSIQYRVANDDVSSQANTIEKIAKKRSYVDAIIYACAISDLFTQDIEDNEQGPQWNPATSTITVKTPAENKSTEKSQVSEAPAVPSGKPQEASALPAIDPPSTIAGAPRKLAEAPQQAPSRAASTPAGTRGPGRPPGSKNKGKVPDIFPPKTSEVKSPEPEKKEEPTTSIAVPAVVELPSVFVPPQGKLLTEKIGQEQTKYLIDLCNKIPIGREHVTKWSQEMFSGKKVSELNYVQFKLVCEFLEKGNLQKNQIDALVNLVKASTKSMEQAEAWIKEKFNKPMRFMYPSEVIEFHEWIQG